LLLIFCAPSLSTSHKQHSHQQHLLCTSHIFVRCAVGWSLASAPLFSCGQPLAGPQGWPHETRWSWSFYCHFSLCPPVRKAWHTALSKAPKYSKSIFHISVNLAGHLLQQNQSISWNDKMGKSQVKPNPPLHQLLVVGHMSSKISIPILKCPMLRYWVLFLKIKISDT